MTETFHVVPTDLHNQLVEVAYRQRGFNSHESRSAAEFSAHTSRHGIRTHNALKALHLDTLFGSRSSGCVPNAQIQKHASRFAATQVWNANKKLGQATALEAIEACIQLADVYGVGIVSIDQAFHYLWGGGYVMNAAQRGYIAYTHCTSALAEVVPFGGSHPTLGTNPHSWAFPTTDAIGYPIVVDFATSALSMGRVQQIAREGETLRPGVALDTQGQPTTDPNAAAALLPFGRRKGYGLGLVNELIAAFTGGSLPTLRCRTPQQSSEKHTPSFYFQVIHPDALSSGAFAQSRNQSGNIKAVLEDILGPGNEDCRLPGQDEAEAAQQSDAAGGLLFSKAEIDKFSELAKEIGFDPWNSSHFPIHT